MAAFFGQGGLSAQGAVELATDEVEGHAGYGVGDCGHLSGADVVDDGVIDGALGCGVESLEGFGPLEGEGEGVGVFHRF